MIDHRKARWKNRLISAAPWISQVSELARLVQAAGAWRRKGWTAPPPYFVRRAMLRSEALAIGAEVFIETGTFLGDTTWGLMRDFRTIYTLEVEPTLAALARERFRKCPSVTLVEGDSSLLLPEICAKVDAPCLFYLDGHYSGGITGMGSKECPILEELHAIFTHTTQPFRIVIDDARLFGTDPFYPDLETLGKLLSDHGRSMQLRIENDAILIA
ncbi:MAG: hypothetical protein WCH43_14045 [Verrucomicrobiota bacterium]